jgi:hypothetical protein
MTEPESSSFIPKRKSAGSERQVKRRNFFIFSIVSYAIFAAAPIASASVYIYQIYTQKIFDKNVAELDAQVKTYSQADMSLVLDFNSRLEITKRLMQSHVSLVSLFNILESSTIKSIQFNDLKITRVDDSSLSVEANIAAKSLDSVLFQREVYSSSQSIASTTFSKLTFEKASEQNSNSVSPTSYNPYSFTAKLVFSKDDIFYSPGVFEIPTSNVIPEQSSSTDVIIQNSTSTETIVKENTP